MLVNNETVVCDAMYCICWRMLTYADVCRWTTRLWCATQCTATSAGEELFPAAYECLFRCIWSHMILKRQLLEAYADACCLWRDNSSTGQYMNPTENDPQVQRILKMLKMKYAGINTYTHTHTHTHTYTHTHTHTRIHTHTHTRATDAENTQDEIRRQMSSQNLLHFPESILSTTVYLLYKHINIYIYVCMYVCIYIYVYI
jgi:hypothetical protein